MPKTTKTKEEVAAGAATAPWLSPIVKKSKKLPSRKNPPPIVSPIMDWLRTSNESQIRRKRSNLSVPTRSYKSQVSDYHNDPSNPAPGDLVMATAGQMSHPAFTMKESIGAT